MPRRVGRPRTARRWLAAWASLTHQPYLLALADEYTDTVSRLERSFVGPEHLDTPEPVALEQFWDEYRGDGADGSVAAFRELQREASDASGLACGEAGPTEAYDRYRQWLPFHHRGRTVIDRVTVALGYDQGAAR